MDLKQLLNLGWIGSIIGLIGIIASLAGVIVSVGLYYASKNVGRIGFMRRTLSILSAHGYTFSEHIKILFHDIPLKRLSRTEILFWNCGKIMLKGSDVVSDDPLRFEFPAGTQVLQARVIHGSRSVNKIEAVVTTEKANEVTIKFDFLDPNDGAWMELLHTADSGPTALGTMRGVPEGLVDIGGLGDLEILDAKQQRRQRMNGILDAIKVLPVFAVSAIAVVGEMLNDSLKSSVWGKPILLSIFVLMFISLIIMFVRWLWRRTPPPKKLLQIT